MLRTAGGNMSEQAEELTTRQVAALIGATPDTINKAIRAGRLPARKEETPRGPIYWVTRADAEAYRASVTQWHEKRPRVRGRRETG